MPRRTTLSRAVVVIACIAIQASFSGAYVFLALHGNDHQHAVDLVRDAGHVDIVLSHSDGGHHGSDAAPTDVNHDGTLSIDGAPIESDHVLHANDSADLATRASSWAWAAPPEVRIALLSIPDPAPRVAVRPAADLCFDALDPLRTVVLRL